MKRDLILYERALFLRIKKGYSYREIMDEVPVGKGTLSSWLSKIEISEDHKARIESRSREAQITTRFNIAGWNHIQRQQAIRAIRVAAKEKIGSLSDRELLVAGTMLYWAEGNKTTKSVQISNADPVLIQFMMIWFRRCLGIDESRFRAAIHYHQGQDYNKIQEFWSKVTGIPLESFNKPFCKPPGTGHRTHYLQWGVCRIYIARSADLLHQILAWKDGLIQDRISGINSK